MYISKNNEYKNHTSAVTDSNEKMTIAEVSGLLSVSQATVRNWIRLGKIKPEPDNKTFNRLYIEKLIEEISCGKDHRLKSRRNKKNISGKLLYKDYIKSKTNKDIVKNILNSCNSLSEQELRIILAHFAVRLYQQSGGKILFNDAPLKNKAKISENEVFNTLIADLIGNTDTLDLSNIRFIFDYQPESAPFEDTLGFIYISLKDLNKRKLTGTYYTPQKTVNSLISSLSDCIDPKTQTICDPCCGTGNFLIGLVSHGVNPAMLYGYDIDEISIYITRINMFLLNPGFTKNQLYSQFVCKNTLAEEIPQVFSVILGNPPWGYAFSEEELAYLKKRYLTAKTSGTESFDLFVEKGLALLEEDGYLSYVLPESVLNVASHRDTRELIIKNTSFKFVTYSGNAFSDVLCPSVILGLKKDGRGKTIRCKVSLNGVGFTINKDRKLDSESLPLNMTDEEYDCLSAITSIPKAEFLAGNAVFGLGIVTGNNKQYISNEKSNGSEIILRGSNIFRYSVSESSEYIYFTPEKFQQTAPAHIYRAKEKLLYRFISDVPVFAYDNRQTLSLNSCNILIPQIDTMDIKYILAILNSSVSAYFFNKKYNSVKLLKAHIEALPIPVVSEEKQKEIIKKADEIMKKGNAGGLYDELDNDIMDIYALSHSQKNIIKASLAGKNRFLKP